VIAPADKPSCWHSGARRGVLVVWRYQPPGVGWPDRPAWLRWEAHCLASTPCRARRDKQAARSSVRSGALYLYERPCAVPPRGACQWCGEPIVLVDASDYRRRQRTVHHGDEHEVGGHRSITFATNATRTLQDRS
jgi:hypothetical protein